MSFTIRIKGSAAKELERIAKAGRARIVDAIVRLSENPFLGSALKGELRGLRQLRIGDCRVLYELQHGELVVLVIPVAGQREAYRKSWEWILARGRTRQESETVSGNQERPFWLSATRHTHLSATSEAGLTSPARSATDG